MARNEGRRAHVTDSAIAVLADAGGRGLTFRAVDARGGLPAGTTSNYFRARAALVAAAAERILARLAPSPATLESFAARPPGPDLYRAYVRDIVRRLRADREASLAWFELRLHGAREADLGEHLLAARRAAFAADVAFAAEAGLPGGRREVELLHYAVDGLVLDVLTGRLDPASDVDEIADALVASFLGI